MPKLPNQDKHPDRVRHAVVGAAVGGVCWGGIFIACFLSADDYGQAIECVRLHAVTLTNWAHTAARI